MCLEVSYSGCIAQFIRDGDVVPFYIENIYRQIIVKTVTIVTNSVSEYSRRSIHSVTARPS